MNTMKKMIFGSHVASQLNMSAVTASPPSQRVIMMSAAMGKRVEQDDEQSVHSGPEPAACLVFRNLSGRSETVIGTMGEDARGKECGGAPQMASSIMPQSEPPLGGHSLCGDRRPRSGREVYFEIPILHRRAAHVVAHHPFDVPLRLAEGAVRTTFCAMVAACS